MSKTGVIHGEVPYHIQVVKCPTPPGVHPFSKAQENEGHDVEDGCHTIK